MLWSLKYPSQHTSPLSLSNNDNKCIIKALIIFEKADPIVLNFISNLKNIYGWKCNSIWILENRERLGTFKNFTVTRHCIWILIIRRLVWIKYMRSNFLKVILYNIKYKCYISETPFGKKKQKKQKNKQKNIKGYPIIKEIGLIATNWTLCFMMYTSGLPIKFSLPSELIYCCVYCIESSSIYGSFEFSRCRDAVQSFKYVSFIWQFEAMFIGFHIFEIFSSFPRLETCLLSKYKGHNSYLSHLIDPWTLYFFQYYTIVFLDCPTGWTVRGAVIDLRCFQNHYITFIIFNDMTCMWCLWFVWHTL